jgi:hypothetical protein
MGVNMSQDEQFIEKLAVEHFPPEKQSEILDELNFRVGDAMMETLSEQQQSEYEAIINADQAVIDAWLNQNLPDYKNTPLYKEVAEGYDQDPEHIDPAKVVASVGWVEVNVPDIQEITNRIIETYKAELASTHV